MNTYIGILRKNPTLEDKQRVLKRLEEALIKEQELLEELQLIQKAKKTLAMHLSE